MSQETAKTKRQIRAEEEQAALADRLKSAVWTNLGLPESKQPEGAQTLEGEVKNTSPMKETSPVDEVKETSPMKYSSPMKDTSPMKNTSPVNPEGSFTPEENFTHREVKNTSPMKETSPLKYSSPMKDTSPMRTPEIDALREMKSLAKFGFYALLRSLLPADGGTVCVADLARETGMTERVLQMHFADLEAAGWFRTVGRAREGKRIVFVVGEEYFTPKRSSSSSLSLESKEKTTTVVTQYRSENVGEENFTHREVKNTSPMKNTSPNGDAKPLPSDLEVIALSVLSSRKQREAVNGLNATVIKLLSGRMRNDGPVYTVAVILEGTRPEVRDIAAYIHGMLQNNANPKMTSLQNAEKVLDRIQSFYAYIGYNIGYREWIKAARSFGIKIYPETEEEAKRAQTSVIGWARTFAAL